MLSDQYTIDPARKASTMRVRSTRLCRGRERWSGKFGPGEDGEKDKQIWMSALLLADRLPYSVSKTTQGIQGQMH